MIGGETEKAIRERAYWIWEAEGRPDGREADHWHRAMQEQFAGAPIGVGAMAAAGAAVEQAEADTAAMMAGTAMQESVVKPAPKARAKKAATADVAPAKTRAKAKPKT